MRHRQIESVPHHTWRTNMSSLNIARQHAEHSLHDIAQDLVRYGIDVAKTDVLMIDIQPVPSDKADPIPTEGCEVLELPTEVVICDYPVTESWCEIVPVRRRPPPLKKEIENGAVAC